MTPQAQATKRERESKVRRWVRAVAPALSGAVAGILAGMGVAHSAGVRDAEEKAQEQRIVKLESKADMAFEAVIRMDERWDTIQTYMRNNDARWIRVFGEK